VKPYSPALHSDAKGSVPLRSTPPFAPVSLALDSFNLGGTGMKQLLLLMLAIFTFTNVVYADTLTSLEDIKELSDQAASLLAQDKTKKQSVFLSHTRLYHQLK
jgi:hypothetical protein